MARSPAKSEQSGPRPTCRDHLLDAAEEVIIRSGMGTLTLDAVAAHAKISKGGLLYHFPSKDALILAIVERLCNNWREDYTRAIADEPDGPGRIPRALLKLCMGSKESCSETCRRAGVVLVAAMVNNPALAAPLRLIQEDLRARLLTEPGGSAGRGAGEAVVLALNGLWFEQVFGIGDLSGARLDSVRGALTRLIDAAQSPSTTPKKAPSRARTANRLRKPQRNRS